MLSMLLDREPLTESEKENLVHKLKRLNIGMMTPKAWTLATGSSEDHLVSFVKEHCRIHNIRLFLSGEEQLGRAPKLIVFDSDAGKTFFLVSLKPDYPEAPA